MPGVLATSTRSFFLDAVTLFLVSVLRAIGRFVDTGLCIRLVAVVFRTFVPIVVLSGTITAVAHLFVTLFPFLLFALLARARGLVDGIQVDLSCHLDFRLEFRRV